MVKNLYDNLRIKRIAAINKLNVVQTEGFHRSNRPVTGIALKMKGQTVYKQNNKRFVSNSQSSVLLPYGSSYSVIYEELGECILIEMVLEDISRINELNNDLFFVHLKNSVEIHELAYRLYRTWERLGECPKTFSLLYGLISMLSECVNSAYSSKSKINIIKPSVDKMLSDFSNPEILMTDLAMESGISDVYFRKLFRECYGIPPAKYLSGLRINKAKQLLLSDGVSVGEAAFAVGFSDIYVFSKAFKRAVGVSPSEYIKNGGEVL